MLIFKKLLTFIFVIFVPISQSLSIPDSPPDKDVILKNMLINDVFIGDYNHADRLYEIIGLPLFVFSGIVHKMLSISFSSFSLLNNYAKHSQYANISFAILKELFVALEDNGGSNIDELCKLYRTYNEKLISSTDDGSKITKTAKLIFEKIHWKIVKEAARKLKSEIVKDQFSSSEIPNEVLLANELLFDQTICQTVNESYNSMRFHKLVKTMWALSQTSQKAAALICVFKSLNRNLYGNLNAAMILAYYLKKVKDLPDFRIVSEYKRNVVQQIIEKLPSSMQNLLFAEHICIRNVNSQKLIAPQSKVDEYKRFVTQINGTENGVEKWFAKSVDEFTFRFVSAKYHYEHLYAGENFGEINRQLFTWIVKSLSDGDEMMKRINWRVQVKRNDQVTITNEAFKDEFFCSFVGFKYWYEDGSEKRSFNNPGLVKMSSFDNRCRWIVESC